MLYIMKTHQEMPNTGILSGVSYVNFSWCGNVVELTRHTWLLVAVFPLKDVPHFVRDIYSDDDLVYVASFGSDHCGWWSCSTWSPFSSFYQDSVGERVQCLKCGSIPNKWGWPDSPQPSRYLIYADTPLWSAKCIFPSLTNLCTFFLSLLLPCPLWPSFLPLTFNLRI